jgi:hypothetical protein
VKQNAIINITSYGLPKWTFKKKTWVKEKTLPHQKITSIFFLKMNFLENMDIPPSKKNNDKKGEMDLKISLRK